MKSKPNPWSAFEALSGGAVLVEWSRAVNLDCARPFLRPSTQLATTYPCTNRFPCDCRHRLERDRCDNWVAVCDCGECEAIRLKNVDVVTWEPDIPKIVEGVMKLCAWTATAISLNGPKTWVVGSLGEQRRALVLWLGDEEVHLRTAIDGLVSKDVSPFVILSPTRRCFSFEIEGLLKREGSVAVALCDLVALAPSGVMTLVGSPAAVVAQMHAFRRAQGSDFVTTIERIDRNIEAVAKGQYKLQSENEELRRLHADGFLKFATRVRGGDFQAFAVIMAVGNRKAAADFLKIPHRTFYDRVNKWHSESRDYQRMFRLVEWRKAHGRKLKVRLEDSIAFGDSAGAPENPHTIQEVLTEMKNGAVDSRDYPELLRQILEALMEQNPKNWAGVRAEVIAIVKEELA